MLIKMLTSQQLRYMYIIVMKILLNIQINENSYVCSKFHWSNPLKSLFTMVWNNFSLIQPISLECMLRTLLGPNEQKRFTSKTNGFPSESTRMSIIEKSLNCRHLWTLRAKFWILSNNTGSFSLQMKLVFVEGAFPTGSPFSSTASLSTNFRMSTVDTWYSCGGKVISSTFPNWSTTSTTEHRNSLTAMNLTMITFEL